ncbi:glycosyltransferase [Microbispora cellulosiformans]|uniref:Glycosyltransferase n=1 Tax=Microbispora cellulosiformans TaxID=2614688 RepID=A0A5J5KCQ5_9ACTN|nr:glycosyltransferase [Microbispora cellulosiformans]
MAREIRVAVVHGPGPAHRDGVGDYAERLVGALGGAGIDAVGVPVGTPDARSARQWLPATLAAARRVRRLRPDVVHVQFAPSAYRFSGLPGLLPPLLPGGTPLVTTLHEYGWWATPGWVPGAVWRPLERARLWDRETGAHDAGARSAGSGHRAGRTRPGASARGGPRRDPGPPRRRRRRAAGRSGPASADGRGRYTAVADPRRDLPGRDA